MSPKQGGFTLIELLVVIAILVIIASLLMANTRPLDKQAQLQAAAQEVVSVLREARQSSLAVKKYAQYYPSYGVYFDATTNRNEVYTYVDCVADDNNSSSVTYADTFRYVGANNCGGPPGPIATFQFKNGIFVSDIQATTVVDNGGTLGTTTSQLGEFSVLYLRPEPTIWFSDGNVAIDAGTIDIILALPSNQGSTTVSLNSAGLVTIH